eukprot:TRINITY_DN123941_c0_g1_i1.p2 TRINITY_DN123941_c0_g1~~TRINITY_DN123941_c0_g1_i1.p2  ORF type:complete len:199 (-),score=25.01 TRINITY_DN123941_c0_g1_i1:454-1050(-)
MGNSVLPPQCNNLCSGGDSVEAVEVRPDGLSRGGKVGSTTEFPVFEKDLKGKAGLYPSAGGNHLAETCSAAPAGESASSQGCASSQQGPGTAVGQSSHPRDTAPTARLEQSPAAAGQSSSVSHAQDHQPKVEEDAVASLPNPDAPLGTAPAGTPLQLGGAGQAVAGTQSGNASDAWSKGGAWSEPEDPGEPEDYVEHE